MQFNMRTSEQINHIILKIFIHVEINEELCDSLLNTIIKHTRPKTRPKRNINVRTERPYAIPNIRLNADLKEFLVHAIETTMNPIQDESWYNSDHDLIIISRCDIVRLIYGYISHHKLYRTIDGVVNKRFIEPDAIIRKVLQMTDNDNLHYFNFQTYIDRLIRTCERV